MNWRKMEKIEAVLIWLAIIAMAVLVISQMVVALVHGRVAVLLGFVLIGVWVASIAKAAREDR